MSSQLKNPYSKGDFAPDNGKVVCLNHVEALRVTIAAFQRSFRISLFLSTWSILVSSSSRMAGSALLSHLQSRYCDFMYGSQSCLSHNEATMDSTGVEKAQIVYCSIAHERSIRDDMQLNTRYWNEILRFQAPEIRFQLWGIVKPTRPMHFLRFINHIVPS